MPLYSTVAPPQEVYLSALVQDKLNQESLRRSPNIGRMIMHINLLTDLERIAAERSASESDSSDNSDTDEDLPFEIGELARLIEANRSGANKTAPSTGYVQQSQTELNKAIDQLFPPNANNSTITTIEEVEVEDDDDW